MVDLKTFGVSRGEGQYQDEIVYSIALLYNIIITSIENYLQTFNLNTGKMNILLVIKNRAGEEGLSQVDISKYLIVTPSNMTKMLDKLEKEGMVKRYALAGDRRVNRVKITKKGSDLLDAIWNGYQERIKIAVEPLALEQQQKLATLLVGWLEKK